MTTHTRPLALREATQQGLLCPLDHHFALFMAHRGANDALQLASALTSHELSQGHCCLDLSPQSDVGERYALLFEQFTPFTWPSLRHMLMQQSVCAWRGFLILEFNKLYLCRYRYYEQFVADTLNKLSETRYPITSPQRPRMAKDIDWQSVAVQLALRRQLTIIAGGPGTGKTTIVAHVLAQLLEQQLNNRLRIALCAPTGKAAARMIEALHQQLQKLEIPQNVQQQLPQQATTLHRLLGLNPNQSNVKYHAHQPLPVDLLIIDEASMVDLALMAHTLEALLPTTRLILLGDPEQLASVEAGALMREICELQRLGYSDVCAQELSLATGFDIQGKTTTTNLNDNLCVLQKSWRFEADSGIGQFAQAVKNAQVEDAQHLISQTHADLRVYSPSEIEPLRALILKHLGPCFRQPLNMEHAQHAFTQRQKFRILTPLNKSPMGVHRLNQWVVSCLQQAKLLPLVLTSWYPGRFVMIRENLPALGLFNGDLGLTLLDEKNNLWVWFEGRCFRPGQLPQVEDASVMTIHKSQGCEFDHCVLLLPHTARQLLTRELLYTGITRARSQLDLFTHPRTLQQAIQSPTQRKSALLKRFLQQSVLHSTDNA